MTRPITGQEHALIRDAIRAAEAATDGEIYCVVARRSGGYFHAAAAVASSALLVGSLAAAFLLEGWWISIRLPAFVAAQLLALAAACLLLWWWPGLRLLLVPRRLLRRTAHDNAMRQFLARNVHVTAARTGVLIFVSIAERYAEVVADQGINAKVGQEVWDGVIAELVAHARKDRLAEGFVGAIGTVGRLLAQHFPVRAGDRNELDDHLVEI